MINLLGDSFPDIKIKICEIFGFVSNEIVLDGKLFIQAVVQVTRHKRWKVRLAGAKALYDLILRKESHCLFDMLVEEYRRLSQDNNQVQSWCFRVFNGFGE